MKRDDWEDGLLRAAVNVLRPIVEQMLASGVVFGRFERRLRELFVRVGERSFRLPGKPQTDSRIALLTGINRKEVRRIRRARPEEPAAKAFTRNLAADLCGRWLSDPRYSKRAGSPLALPYRAKRGPSFVKLVRSTTVDVRPRVILDELARTGLVEVREDGTILLLSDAYVPRAGAPEKLAMLAEDPPELIHTMIHNILAEDPTPWLQQKVFYDNLGSDGLEPMRAQLRRHGERFLNGADRLLAKQDRDRNPDAPGGERRYAGIGVYYFESAEKIGAKRPERRRSKRGDHDAS